MSDNNFHTTLHKANSRGYVDHGWLKSHHTFSFASYHDPARIHFGRLRVINDDYIAGGKGFGVHPHDNMEIITILLKGALEHKDSMGNICVIKEGAIQVMSAGTGITHSEYNHNSDQPVELLQIWVLPNQKNVTPRHQEMYFPSEASHNKLNQIVSPDPEAQGAWIHQNAWFHLGHFDEGVTATYDLQDAVKNGVYAFVIQGEFTVNGLHLESRDGLGISDISTLKITALEPDSKILLMEIPMQ